MTCYRFCQTNIRSPAHQTFTAGAYVRCDSLSSQPNVVMRLSSRWRPGFIDDDLHQLRQPTHTHTHVQVQGAHLNRVANRIFSCDANISTRVSDFRSKLYLRQRHICIILLRSIFNRVRFVICYG